MFGADAQGYEAGGEAVEEAAAAEGAEEERSFEGGRGGVHGGGEVAVEKAVDGDLEALGDAGGKLAPVLDAGEDVLG